MLVPFALLVMGYMCMQSIRNSDSHHTASSPSTMPSL